MPQSASRSCVSWRSSPLLHAACRLAEYNAWPVLRLAEDIKIAADRNSWLEFLRAATDDELLYAIRTLQARTRLFDAPPALNGEVLRRYLTEDVRLVHDVARVIAARVDARADG